MSNRAVDNGLSTMINNDELLENGYLVLPEWINPGVAMYFNSRVFRYLEVPSANDYRQGEGGGSGEHHRSWNSYGHEAWEAVLEMCCPPLAKKVGGNIVPTYSYQRMYLNGAAMAHHSDRPSCQISLTINLGQSHPWSVYVTSLKTKKYVEIVQKPGDALLYLGCNVSHFRDYFQGDWYSQLFLHYVCANQENAEHFWDSSNRENPEGRHIDYLNESIKHNWKKVLHKDGIMDRDEPYSLDEMSKEHYFPIKESEHPFIKPGNLSKEQEIDKEEFDVELSKNNNKIEMEADPDDLPKIEDIHGNEYDPKQMSDKQHDFAEDDLPDEIEFEDA